jgi:hypothetical protein
MTRVFFYEFSEENQNLDNVDDFLVDLYFSPISKNSHAAKVPISKLEVVPPEKVVFIENVPYYIEKVAASST